MCVYVCVCMYIYIYHIFFIHSSVNGCLGCFHILAVVNNAAVTVGVHVSFQISVFVFFGFCFVFFGVELLSHIVALYFFFF